MTTKPTYQQLSLFAPVPRIKPDLDLESYDKYLVMFSGGKDSTACVLNLIEQGIPVDKIELWHHCIDGDKTFMDWECTESYCKAFAKQFGLSIYFSGREGGFKAEMLRDGTTKTGSVWYEHPEGKTVLESGNGFAKRLRFPQTGSIQSGRWCSAKLKIDVARRIIAHDPRLQQIKVLVITGERAEEGNRAGYAEFEMYNHAAGRKVDQYRPVHKWSEKDVWTIIQKYKIRVHPCYYLGFGRASCKFCIFGNKNQFATAMKISPEIGQEIESFEDQFGMNIKREPLSIFARGGEAYQSANDSNLVSLAVNNDYNQSIIMKDWILPTGAYSTNCGSY